VDIDVILTVLAGGMFGVILGKFLDTTPDWVFWAIVASFFVVVVYLVSTS
jgi:hypothetical protein